MSRELEFIRSRIDELDSEILTLLNRRMSLAVEIGNIKAIEDQPVIDWQREREILERLSGLNTGPLPNAALRAIFNEIFSSARSLQMPLTVAYLGPEGTHSHEAALRYFGASTRYTPCHGLAMTFDEVSSGRADFAVVPAENSLEGSVRESLDLLLASEARICGEVCHEIRHCLVNRSGLLDDVKRILSHPQALAQCRQWLSSRLPDARLEETFSTAAAAEMAVKDKDVAAVAGEKAAHLMGLRVLQSDIQDRTYNVTKFFVVGHAAPRPTGKDRTTLAFWVKNRPGALSEVLTIITAYGINVTKIESRPFGDPGAWEYVFFIDLAGHHQDEPVKRCLDEMKKNTLRIMLLGSYPAADCPARPHQRNSRPVSPLS